MPIDAPTRISASPLEAALFLLSICAAALVLFICWATPLLLLSGPHADDGLFILQGINIANGKWLGPFNVLTLAKGPGYPLFLAANRYTGLPITVSQAILLIFSVGVFSFMVAKVARSSIVGLILFSFTILHPTFILERILRDAIYPSQLFLVLGLLIATFFAYRHRAFLWGSLSGIAGSWFWLNREEGVWILPAVAAIVGFAALRDWLIARELRGTILGIAGFVLFIAIGHVALSTINWVAYGGFQTVDVKERNFQAALTALQSVRDGDQIPYIPVSKSTRQFIYKVSPTFAAMRDSFDPPEGNPPGAGCQYYAWTCGDIAGGWFMFHLKGSASRQGAYKSPAEATAFFKRLADEVNAACDDGRLTCIRNPVPFMPRVTLDQIAQFPAKMWEGVLLLVTPEKWRLRTASTGTPQEIADATAFLNAPLTAGSATSERLAPFVHAATTVRDWWGPIFGWVMTGLLPLGLVSFVGAAIMARRQWPELQLIAIAGSLWILLLARLGLIAMIDMSSFPATNKWYLSPALYLSASASILSIMCLYRTSFGRHRSKSEFVLK